MKRLALQIGMAVALLALACAPQACSASGPGHRYIVKPSPKTIRMFSDQNPGGRAHLLSCESELTESLTQGLSQVPGVQLSLAMADFTGDSNPDTATVNFGRLDAHRAQYFIEVLLTEGGRQLFALSAPPGGLFITPQDVTGDGTLDLVVRATDSRSVVAIFLNDGCGRFSQPAGVTQTRVPRNEGPIFQASRATTMPVVSAVTRWSSDADMSNNPRRVSQQQGARFALPGRPHLDSSALSFGSNRAPPQIG